jgi:hypothetical protein
MFLIVLPRDGNVLVLAEVLVSVGYDLPKEETSVLEK